jgi:hypothetical protein
MVSLAGIFTIQLAHTQKAEAAVYGFCGNVLLGPQGGGNGQTWCRVGMVGTYQAYAWGEHSVCVEVQPWGGTACSSGTNGVYSGQTPPGSEIGWPTIFNNVNISQHASGVYLTH